jgi:tetratricopeptide (TPR) repeat protein
LGSDDHPDDHPDCLETRNSLAGTILYKEGHYDESQRMNERCLETKIGLLGQGHPSTLVSLLNLATVLYKQKSYEQAQYYFIQCLNRKLTLLGKRHPETLRLTASLENTYFYQGMYEEAKELYDACYHKRVAVLGPDHVDTLSTLHPFAMACSKLQYQAQASTAYEICWVVKPRFWGRIIPKPWRRKITTRWPCPKKPTVDKEKHDVCWGSICDTKQTSWVHIIPKR